MLHVVEKTLPLFLLALLGVMVETVFDGATEHMFGLKVAVGLCHNLAVDAAWSVGCRGAVVFYSLLHNLELLVAEPTAQTAVGKHTC